MNKRPIFILLLLVLSCNPEHGEAFLPGPEYTDEYLTEFKGKVDFEFHPLLELTEIITGFAQPLYVNTQSNSFQSADSAFDAFRRHPVVGVYRELIHSSGRHNSLTKGSFAYTLDPHNQISDHPFHPMNHMDGNFQNEFAGVKALVQDFAIQVDYMDYWEGQEIEQERIYIQLQAHSDLLHIKNWLESRFEDRFDTYRCVVSPLTNSSHRVMYFRRPDFNELISFTSYIPPKGDFPSEVIDGLMTRVLFTEIDHPYVDLFSERHFFKRIQKGFQSINYWGDNQDSNYNTAHLIFSEYMTWAVFCLYALDTYSAESATKIITLTSSIMERQRGFRRFSAFKDALTDRYLAQSEPDMYALFDELLTWVENH